MILYLLFGVVIAAVAVAAAYTWGNVRPLSTGQALAGVGLVFLLIVSLVMLLTGRWPVALGVGVFALYQIWRLTRASRRDKRASAEGTAGSKRRASGKSMPRSKTSMSQDEALSVLGLKAGASAKDIKAAYRHLMNVNHPDKGGSQWMAAKLNEARQTLLPDSDREP